MTLREELTMADVSGRWFRLNTTWSQSEWLAELPPASRLAWVELLSYVKAHGFDGKVRSVSPVVFGRMVGIEPADIKRLLAAADADGALIIDGDDWTLTGWQAHQGDPTAKHRMRRYREKQNTEDVTPVTRNDRSVTPTETETETELLEDANASLSGSDKPNADGVREVFEHWRETSGHTTAKLTKDRKAKIQTRLGTFSPPELKKAITNACNDPFYRGDNDRGKRYDWIETLLKNDAAVDRHLNARDGPALSKGDRKVMRHRAEIEDMDLSGSGGLT
jgi:hypothetical protein